MRSGAPLARRVSFENSASAPIFRLPDRHFPEFGDDWPHFGSFACKTL